MKTNDIIKDLKFELCVKISDKFEGIELVTEYSANKVEMQLMTPEIELCKEVLAVGLKDVVVHTPTFMVELPEIVYNKEFRKSTEYLLEECRKLINAGVKVQFLMHASWLDNVKDQDVIDYVITLYDEYRVPLLIENGILLGREKVEYAIKIVNAVNNPNIGFCLDIAHMRSPIKQGEDYKAYFKNIKNCKHIHFKYQQPECDPLNHRIFGFAHPSTKEMISDLEILKNLGINNCVLCTEVGEHNNDWISRPGERKQIENVMSLGIIKR